MSATFPLVTEASLESSKKSVQNRPVFGSAFAAGDFAENFEVLAEAGTGIDQLRGVVLHLALQGRLLQETPLSLDETPTTASLTVPFGLPKGWAWRRVDEAGDLKLGRQRSPKNHTGPNMRPYLRVANVYEARIDTSDVLAMNFEPDEAVRFLLKPNDLLLNEGQSYELVGRPAIYRGEVEGACFQNTLIRFRPGSSVLSDFALIVFRAYMRTGRFRREAQQTTNIAHLSLGRLAVVEFPVPPLAEQERLVGKVAQVMALCDDLEGRQTKKRDVRTRFTRSAIDAVVTANGPDDFDKAWKQVADSFELLSEHRAGVDELRGLVLHLALGGRLLREVPLPPEETSTTAGLMIPFGLPKGWTWKRVAEVGDLKLGRQRSPKNHTGPNMRPYLRVANVHEARIDASNVLSMNFDPGEVERFSLKPNDVLLNEGQSYELVGRPAIYRGEVEGACFQNTLIRFRPGPTILSEFALIVFRAYMRTGRFRREAQQTTNIAHLSLGRLAEIEFPVAPLSEQKRIVAKVEQLLKTCDELDLCVRRAEGFASKLVEAVVHDLVS